MGFISRKASGNAFSSASFPKPVMLQPCQPSSDFCTSRSSTEVLWSPQGSGHVPALGLSTHPALWLLGYTAFFIYNSLESQSIQSCFSAYLSTSADKEEVTVRLDSAAESLYYPWVPWAGAGPLPAQLPHLPSVTPTFHPICNPEPQAAVPVSP